MSDGQTSPTRSFGQRALRSSVLIVAIGLMAFVFKIMLSQAANTLTIVNDTNASRKVIEVSIQTYERNFDGTIGEEKTEIILAESFEVPPHSRKTFTFNGSWHLGGISVTREGPLSRAHGGTSYCFNYAWGSDFTVGWDANGEDIMSTTKTPLRQTFERVRQWLP